MPLYDFVCDNGHKFSDLVQSTVKQVDCYGCGKPAARQLALPKIDYLRMGLDPIGNPSAGEKWAKMQTQKNRTPTSQGGRGS